MCLTRYLLYSLAFAVVRAKILSIRLLDIEVSTKEASTTDAEVGESVVESTMESPTTDEPDEFLSGEEPSEILSPSARTIEAEEGYATENPSEMPTTSGFLQRDFRKVVDFPPGVPDGEGQYEVERRSGDLYSKITDSFKSGSMYRVKRNLSFGLRGVPALSEIAKRHPPRHPRGPRPPPHRPHPNPYRRIGGRHRDKTMFFYDVLIKKVFKGGDQVANSKAAFPDASDPRGRRMFARIYFSSHNGLDLDRRGSYLLSGSIMGNKLVLPSGGCWLDKWTDLAEDEILGLHGQYLDNCKCGINFCFPGRHCERMKAMNGPVCSWELRNFRKPSHDCGARHQICTMNQDSCQWVTGKGFNDCLNPESFIP